jgi:hypothetical protein
VWLIEVYYQEVLVKVDISQTESVPGEEEPSIYKRDVLWAGVR